MTLIYIIISLYLIFSQYRFYNFKKWIKAQEEIIKIHENKEVLFKLREEDLVDKFLNADKIIQRQKKEISDLLCTGK